jgi:hypothetical protein
MGHISANLTTLYKPISRKNQRPWANCLMKNKIEKLSETNITFKPFSVSCIMRTSWTSEKHVFYATFPGLSWLRLIALKIFPSVEKIGIKGTV